MTSLLSTPALTVLGQVLAIDLMLAGDNAVVIGLAVVGLSAKDRRRAIVLGVVAAALIRLALALIAVRLLAVVGLLFTGGLLLLWLCWRMYRELRVQHATGTKPPAHPRSLPSVIARIILADISMSLDNVLAVAGAARNHPTILALGLVVSIALTAIAADRLAKLLEHYRWIAWIGLAVVLYVSLNLIWDGGREILLAMPRG